MHGLRVTWRGGAILRRDPIGCESQLKRGGGRTCDTTGAVVDVVVVVD